MEVLADLPEQVLTDALRHQGIWLDVGSASVRLRSDSKLLARQLQLVYRHFPVQTAAEWTDVHIDIRHARGLRRWIRPQVDLTVDARQPFDPFPADSPLPLFEWGCNWTLGQRLNDLLLLHAGVLEKDGYAIVLPATPGSGKSTLTAALSLRGWRLLSDEFGALDPQTGALRAVLKPPALKNQSIAVIRRFEPSVEMGVEFPKTRKGTVVHLAPSRDAVARRHEIAMPAMIVLPRWDSGAATEWTQVPGHTLFAELAFNAFNYRVLGAAGFNAVVRVVRQCPSWRLVYSDLQDAVDTIEATWRSVIEQRQSGGAAA